MQGPESHTELCIQRSRAHYEISAEVGLSSKSLSAEGDTWPYCSMMKASYMGYNRDFGFLMHVLEGSEALRLLLGPG